MFFQSKKNKGLKKHKFRQDRRNKSVGLELVNYLPFIYRQQFVDVWTLASECFLDF